MQPILVTTQYPDLYRFLAALSHEVENARAVGLVDSVVIYSPEERARLLDDSGKLELVERYARKLGVRVVLSAACDQQLRLYGHKMGWTVLWDVPSLDNALTENEYQDELDEAIAS